MSYPGAMRLTRKIAAKAIFLRFHLALLDVNSIPRAELELAGFSRRRDEQWGCVDGPAPSSGV